MNEDDINYVEPDISIICDLHKLTDKGCLGAPDWIIEIVSPGSRRMVYNFESEDTGDYTFTDSVKAGIYEDLYIDFFSIAKQLGLT